MRKQPLSFLLFAVHFEPFSLYALFHWKEISSNNKLKRKINFRKSKIL